ncbi:MAG: hypothetical protein ACI311_07135 [Bacilli bacterium]
MKFGLEVLSFKDYRSITKKMRMCGVKYFVISLSSILDLKNLTPHFLEKTLGLKANKIDDLYSYYIYQECETFTKDKDIAHSLKTCFSTNASFNVWLTKLVLLQLKSVYKYLKYKNIYMVLIVDNYNKKINQLNKYCDYFYEYKSKLLLDKKGKYLLKGVLFQNLNMISSENFLYIIDYQIFNKLSMEEMENLYVASCK